MRAFANWTFYSRTILTKFLAVMHCSICEAKCDSAIPLCKDCEKNFLERRFKFRLENEERFCTLCGKELISEFSICQRCKKSFVVADPNNDASKKEGEKRQDFLREVFFERNFALFPYIGDGQKLLTAWKNKSYRNCSKLFSKFILEFLAEKDELKNLSLVPVPARPSKLKVKAWDQIKDLAFDLKLEGKKILPCLKRRDGTSQKTVAKKARLENLKGKFYVDKKFRNKVPEKLIVFDDIVTSASTINECAKVLKEAGCKKVYTLCLFYD